MRMICRVVLVFGLAALVATPTFAQRQRGQQQRGQRGQGGQGGVGALLQNESVQKELKIDKEQADKVKEAVQKVREKHRDEFAKLRDLGQDERRAKTQELNRVVAEETLQAVGDILKPEQLKRLKQIDLQQAGAQAFNRPDVQKALSLTDEQKEKVKTINDDAAKEMRDLRQGGNAQGNREKIAALRKETMEKIQSVLTDEQKKTLKELAGAPFQIAATPRRRANNQ